jgi:hypothetical protein
MVRRSRRVARSGDPSAGVADEQVVVRLELLYAELPPLPCLGLCANSCNAHVDASQAERRRIAALGVDLDAPTDDDVCPALTRTAVGALRCAVHEVRPMVCRLWGTAEALPCPHGCRPQGGPVTDAQALRWLLASLHVGGHQDADAGELETALSDATAAALLSRLLRGDRSAAADLLTCLKSELHPTDQR